MDAVQMASQTLLFCWAGSGTETGQEPGALRLGEQELDSQVKPSLMLSTTLLKKEKKKKKNNCKYMRWDHNQHYYDPQFKKVLIMVDNEHENLFHISHFSFFWSCSQWIRLL